ncbi:MAG: hypothetical protein ABSA49_06780 [Rhizomicrobium sp.]
MSGWDACTQEPNVLLRWIECHPAFLAATQDFFTFVAIAVAIGIPLWTAQREKQLRASERNISSQVFAASLLAPFSAAKMDIARIKHGLRQLEVRPARWPGIPDALRQLKIQMPVELENALARFHEFDREIIGPLNTAITMIIAYNAYVDQLYQASADDIERYERGKARILSNLGDRIEGLDASFACVIGLPAQT